MRVSECDLEMVYQSDPRNGESTPTVGNPAAEGWDYGTLTAFPPYGQRGNGLIGNDKIAERSFRGLTPRSLTLTSVGSDTLLTGFFLVPPKGDMDGADNARKPVWRKRSLRSIRVQPIVRLNCF